ncbi:uncharacterized protein TNIN_270951 [Trichonephila inaurata madagascariensis]|uniref:SMB domain-containing protein n=1 Tax=Trichonephila inaurata madagascariensis TaxID=2747483 RepID=A0A8X6WL68_9ARAC|nr:uncharacterized protein TNIN_270951 [Trichonephila inaurata madagascariensis]
MTRFSSTVLVLFTISFCVTILLAEHRKLIPKCSNSCLTSGSVKPTNCFCDSKCSLIYNDCCLDAPYRTFRVNTRRNHNINCVFVHGENKHFWMVDTCKSSWVGHDHIREKCNETSLVSGESSDIIGSIPVTNPKEGVTFKNYYCAMCNDDATEDLVEWQVKALCADDLVSQEDILQNLTFVEDKQQWGVWKYDTQQDWTFHECYLLFQRPSNITNGIRHCTAGMISSCPRFWQHIATRRKCKSYVDPVRWSDGPVFRNIDCAMCHNRTSDQFQCVKDVTSSTSAVMLSRAMKVDISCSGQWL